MHVLRPYQEVTIRINKLLSGCLRTEFSLSRYQLWTYLKLRLIFNRVNKWFLPKFFVIFQFIFFKSHNWRLLSPYRLVSHYWLICIRNDFFDGWKRSVHIECFIYQAILFDQRVISGVKLLVQVTRIIGRSLTRTFYTLSTRRSSHLKLR